MGKSIPGRVEYFRWILHICEEESSGRGRSTGFRAVLVFYNMPEFVRVYAPEAYVEQSSHYGPDHVAQETVRLDSKKHCIFGDIPAGRMDLTIIGFGICINLAETGEI